MIDAIAYAEMQFKLLPPSRLWKTMGLLWNAFLATGDELVRVDARGVDLLDESDPRTATETLAEWERALNLPSTGTTAERQARITALVVRRQRVRPVDYQEALAPILGLLASQVEVIETSRATAILVGDDRIIYQFYIYRDPGLGGTYDVDEAQEFVDAMSHSHTKGVVIESKDFLAEDPFSLTDRDILGA